MTDVNFWVTFLANLFAGIAALIAIYVFFFNREKIKNALNTLVNYSYQITLSELKYKIERLNDYNANDADSKLEVINILNEIEGQINGNKSLKLKLPEQLEKISNFIENVKLITEPKKRSLVSELRESIRHLDVSNFNKIIRN